MKDSDKERQVFKKYYSRGAARPGSSAGAAARRGDGGHWPLYIRGVPNLLVHGIVGCVGAGAGSYPRWMYFRGSTKSSTGLIAPERCYRATPAALISRVCFLRPILSEWRMKRRRTWKRNPEIRDRSSYCRKAEGETETLGMKRAGDWYCSHLCRGPRGRRLDHAAAGKQTHPST